MTSKKKAIIIGLDGCRPDVVVKIKAPNLHRLAKMGKYSWQAQTEIQTISGPAWTSLLTGVHSDKHNIFDNNFKPRNLKYETIFKYLKEFDPTLRAVAHSHWAPIIKHIFEPKVLDRKSSGGDKKMTYRLVSDIKKDRGDLFFIQLDDCDGAGHRYEYGPHSEKYCEQVLQTDRYVGEILDAIETRPKNEEWLIIAMTDHGGSGKSHGMANMDCITVFILISQLRTPLQNEELEYNDNEEDFPELVDIPPTIAEFFGMEPKNAWDGKSLL